MTPVTTRPGDIHTGNQFYILKQHFLSYFSFFFNDTATTEIYTLSLHDALPIYGDCVLGVRVKV